MLSLRRAVNPLSKGALRLLGTVARKQALSMKVGNS